MTRRFLPLLVLCGLVLLAPSFAPFDPAAADPARQLQPPSIEYPLGTDLLGRDVLSRALYGGQRTLLIALLSTGIALLPGILIGVIAGIGGRWVDETISILLNGVLAFPSLLLALLILTLVGQGALSLGLATGVAQIAPCARLTRSAVIGVRSAGHVEAAHSVGAPPLWIVLYHLLPNILSTLLAYSGVVFGYSILNSAALSFLGLGGEPGIPDWGVMLYEGRQVFRLAPWVAFAPGVGITLLVFAANRLTR